MKIGCCVNMLASGEDPIGSGWIPVLKKSGYDYVELPLAQVMELSEEEFQALLAVLKENEIPCECCNNFFPASVRLTGEKASFEKAEEYICEAVKRAFALGAEVIVFGSAGAKNVPEGFDRKTAFQQVVRVLKTAGSVCREYGISIAIEPLNRKESNFILNLSEGKALMDAVSLPEIGVLADYYHFISEQDTASALRQAGDRLWHVHFAEPDGRTFPLSPHQEYRDFFKILKEMGYEGRCSIEAYSQNPEDDLKEGFKILKNCIS